MSESKRPWYYDESGNIYSGQDDNGVALHLFEPFEVSDDDVELVVRSVNSRDLAVEAMENAEKFIGTLTTWSNSDPYQQSEAFPLLQELRTALAAMKGDGHE